jgi:hypothetical protein
MAQRATAGRPARALLAGGPVALNAARSRAASRRPSGAQCSSPAPSETGRPSTLRSFGPAASLLARARAQAATWAWAGNSPHRLLPPGPQLSPTRCQWISAVKADPTAGRDLR